MNSRVRGSRNCPPQKFPLGLSRFRLRSLLLFIAVASIWLGIETQRARRQARFVADVLHDGGQARYEYQYPFGGVKSGWRSWLAGLVGVDYVYSVSDVSLAGFSRERLACLDELPSSPRALDLSGSEVNDDDLACLLRLDELEELDLSATRITDAALGVVGSLHGLRRLRICDPVTYYDPAAPGCDQRTYHMLCAHEPRVTDAGLSKLQSLSELESLDLQGNDISIAGTAHLKGLPRLKDLNLRATNVSETAIAELTTAIPRLRVDRFFPPRPSTENGEWAILPAEVVRELRREANP